MQTKVAVIIPARLSSMRFPRKILHPFFGIPMVEHVRRRAGLAKSVSSIHVATCDTEIADVVRSYGGQVIMTSSAHRNGTDRVAEAVDKVDCTHVIVLQGDEPLILPDEIEKAVNCINERPEVVAWNATARILDETELDAQSVVKCIISKHGKILICFRKTPSGSQLEHQQPFLRKIIGFIAFEKYFIKHLSATGQAPMELSESVEQLRILENDFELRSIPLNACYPSVNLPSEALLVETSLKTDSIQQEMLRLTGIKTDSLF